MIELCGAIQTHAIDAIAVGVLGLVTMVIGAVAVFVARELGPLARWRSGK